MTDATVLLDTVKARADTLRRDGGLSIDVFGATAPTRHAAVRAWHNPEMEDEPTPAARNGDFEYARPRCARCREPRLQRHALCFECWKAAGNELPATRWMNDPQGKAVVIRGDD